MSDLPPPPAPDGQPQPVPGAQPQPQVVYVEKEKKSRKGCLIGAGVAMVLLLGGCVAVIATAGSVVEEIDNEIQEQQDQRAADEALVEDNATITRCELNESLGWAEVDVEFTNPLDEEKGLIIIEVNVLDPEGVVVGSANINFENLSPGQTARGSGSAVDFAEGATIGECAVVDGSVL